MYFDGILARDGSVVYYGTTAECVRWLEDKKDTSDYVVVISSTLETVTPAEYLAMFKETS